MFVHFLWTTMPLDVSEKLSLILKLVKKYYSNFNDLRAENFCIDIQLFMPWKYNFRKFTWSNLLENKILIEVFFSF